MPCKRSGRGGQAILIDIATAMPWAYERREQRKDSERDRLARAQADKFELENGRRRGTLLLASEVAEQDQAIAADFAARLDGLPGRLANEIAAISDPADVRRRLLEELRSVREAFAHAIRKQADAPVESSGDGPDHDAAAEQDGGRMGGPEQGIAGGELGAGALAQ